MATTREETHRICSTGVYNVTLYLLNSPHALRCPAVNGNPTPELHGTQKMRVHHLISHVW